MWHDHSSPSTPLPSIGHAPHGSTVSPRLSGLPVPPAALRRLPSGSYLCLNPLMAASKALPGLASPTLAPHLPRHLPTGQRSALQNACAAQLLPATGATGLPPLHPSFWLKTTSSGRLPALHQARGGSVPKLPLFSCSFISQHFVPCCSPPAILLYYAMLFCIVSCHRVLFFTCSLTIPTHLSTH